MTASQARRSPDFSRGVTRSRRSAAHATLTRTHSGARSLAPVTACAIASFQLTASSNMVSPLPRHADGAEERLHRGLEAEVLGHQARVDADRDAARGERPERERLPPV